MNELLDQFVLEARDLIQEGSEDLVALERAPDDPERLERIFRAFHTLKGGAAIVDLPVMAGLLHAGEDVLASLRAREILVSPTVIDTALRCLDEAGHWLDVIEAAGTLPAWASDQAEILTRELRQHLPQSRPPAPREAGPEFDWARALIAATPGAADDVRRNGGAVAIAYEPDVKCFFNGDDPIGLVRKVPRLLAVKIEPRAAWPQLQDMNPFDCNLAIRALSLAPRSQIAEIFRFVLGQARIADVALDPAGAEDVAQPALIRAILQAQRDLLADPCAEQEFIGRLGAAARAAANVLRFARADTDAAAIARAHEEATACREAGPVVNALDSLLAAHASASLESAAAAPVMPTPGGPSRGGRALRIEEAKVDTLLNVAGELIVAMNGLNELSERIVRELGEGETVRALRSQNADIGRLVTQAHRAVVQLRLVPLAQPFRRCSTAVKASRKCCRGPQRRHVRTRRTR